MQGEHCSNCVPAHVPDATIKPCYPCLPDDSASVIVGSCWGTSSLDSSSETGCLVSSMTLRRASLRRGGGRRAEHLGHDQPPEGAAHRPRGALRRRSGADQAPGGDAAAAHRLPAVEPEGAGHGHDLLGCSALSLLQWRAHDHKLLCLATDSLGSGVKLQVVPGAE